MSKYMLLGLNYLFLLTTRVNFDTISKLGTCMYYIGGIRTHNGIGTIQYIKVLYIYIYIHYVSTRTLFVQWHYLLI